jgi:hypothetical protein
MRHACAISTFRGCKAMLEIIIIFGESCLREFTVHINILYNFIPISDNHSNSVCVTYGGYVILLSLNNFMII